MSSSQKAKIALALALILLCLSGIAAGLVIFRLYEAQAQIRHTYEVEVAIGDLESTLTEVGRTRVAYVDSASPESLKNFETAIGKVGPALSRIRQSTTDNPSQLALCDRLEINASQRIAASQQSVELRTAKPIRPSKRNAVHLGSGQKSFRYGGDYRPNEAK